MIPADRGVVADLSRRDAQHGVRRARLRLLLRRRFRLIRQARALLVQKRRHLMPRGVVADLDVGHDVHQQALAVLAQVLRMHRHADRVGDRDRAVLRDVVLDVYRTHCGKREIEAGHQRHDGRERQRERVRQRNGVTESQPRDVGVRGDVGSVDLEFVDGERAVGKRIAARHERQRSCRGAQQVPQARRLCHGAYPRPPARPGRRPGSCCRLQRPTQGSRSRRWPRRRRRACRPGTASSAGGRPHGWPAGWPRSSSSR